MLPVAFICNLKDLVLKKIEITSVLRHNKSRYSYNKRLHHLNLHQREVDGGDAVRRVITYALTFYKDAIYSMQL
jgi:hypothetical protein